MTTADTAASDVQVFIAGVDNPVCFALSYRLSTAAVGTLCSRTAGHEDEGGNGEEAAGDPGNANADGHEPEDAQGDEDAHQSGNVKRKFLPLMGRGPGSRYRVIASYASAVLDSGGAIPGAASKMATLGALENSGASTSTKTSAADTGDRSANPAMPSRLFSSAAVPKEVQTHFFDFVGKTRNTIELMNLIFIPEVSLIPPAHVAGSFQSTDTAAFEATVLASKVIIVDIVHNISEALAIVKILDQNASKFVYDPKILIAVSTVLTWGRTKPNPDDPTAAIPEDEFRRRKPHPNFKRHIDLEKEWVRLGKKECYRPYVVFAGLVYHCGESIFHTMLQRAWHGEPIVIYGSGSNQIPMIHLQDLINVIISTVENIPAQRYILALDSANNTFYEVAYNLNFTKAIDSAFGSPGIQIKPAEHALVDGSLSQTFRDMLSVDLRLLAAEAYNYKFKWLYKSGLLDNLGRFVDEFKRARGLTPMRILVLGPPYSGKTILAKRLAEYYKLPYIDVESVFSETVRRLEIEIKASKDASEAGDDDDSPAAQKSAPATAGGKGTSGALAGTSGDADNVEIEAQTELLRELSECLRIAHNNRTPGKTIVIQPAAPAGGQSSGGSQLSSQIGSKVVLGSGNAAVAAGTMGSGQVANSGAAKEQFGSQAAGASGTGASGSAVPIVENPFPESHITSFLRSKMQSMKCLNQGYVLDGYPTTVQEAGALFARDASSEEGTGNSSSAGASDARADHKSANPNAPDSTLAPTNVMVIKCPDHIIKDRAMKLLEAEQTILTCEAGINKRLEDHAKRSGDESTVLNYFDEAEIFAQFLDTTTTRSPDAVFEDAVRVLGRPHNYGPPRAVIEIMKGQKADETARLEKRGQAEEAARVKEEADRAERAMQEWNAKLEEVRRQEQVVLEAQSLPLRQYLMKNVMPHLTSGLIELCKVRPEDPIDYLAEYLFRQASGAAARVDIPFSAAVSPAPASAKIGEHVDAGEAAKHPGATQKS